MCVFCLVLYNNIDTASQVAKVLQKTEICKQKTHFLLYSIFFDISGTRTYNKRALANTALK